jgi:hypothetical protein
MAHEELARGWLACEPSSSASRPSLRWQLLLSPRFLQMQWWALPLPLTNKDPSNASRDDSSR